MRIWTHPRFLKWLPAVALLAGWICFPELRTGDHREGTWRDPHTLCFMLALLYVRAPNKTPRWQCLRLESMNLRRSSSPYFPFQYASSSLLVHRLHPLRLAVRSVLLGALIILFGVGLKSWVADVDQRLEIERQRRLAEKRFACPTCGYDLRATPDRCPECGRKIFN